MRSPFRRRLGVAALAILLAGAAAAQTDDRQATEALLQQLEQKPAQAKLAKQPIEQAHAALERATDARAAADHDHAAMLDGLAREWATTGRDLVRAAEAEQRAAKAQREAAELEAKTIRAQALLEETVARRGRAREKLEELEQRADGGLPVGASVDGGAP